MVDRFDMKRHAEAIVIQSALEGLAARQAAERGARPRERAQVARLLARMDAIVGAAPLSRPDLARYVALNGGFHELVLALALPTPLARQMACEFVIPFTLADLLALGPEGSAELRRFLTLEQDQHHRLVRLIETGDGCRAEALAREHAGLLALYRSLATS